MIHRPLPQWKYESAGKDKLPEPREEGDLRQRIYLRCKGVMEADKAFQKTTPIVENVNSGLELRWIWEEPRWEAITPIVIISSMNAMDHMIHWILWFNDCSLWLQFSLFAVICLHLQFTSGLLIHLTFDVSDIFSFHGYLKASYFLCLDLSHLRTTSECKGHLLWRLEQRNSVWI